MKKNIIWSIICLVLCIVFGLGGWYIAKNNQTESQTNQESQTESINKNTIWENIIGTYTYDGIEAGTDYGTLKLNSDFTYTYEYGMHNGGEYSAAGNYAITSNEIYLYNDKCELGDIGDGCSYVNCEHLLKLTYELNDNQITIYHGNTLMKKNS